MKTLAIIAEYNPFHNGHLYHLKQSLKKTNSENSICIMSGNFTQRGEPALGDKYSRAYAACLSGIDAVFELPTIYATSNASEFAMGAVSLLSDTKAADYLCFGAETDDIEMLSKIAHIISDEPYEYKCILQDYIKDGLSYPAARQSALIEFLGNDISTIISEPNNILGIEYISSIIKTSSSMKPVLIKRNKAMYHDTDVNQSISSATAIRYGLSNNIDITSDVPENTLTALKEYLQNKLVSPEGLTLPLSIIHHTLKYSGSFRNYLDASDDIINRFIKCPFPAGYNDICNFMKTKNLTMTRIKRCLIHMILNITDEKHNTICSDTFSHYLNLLSFRGSQSSVIKKINQFSTVPVITKKADYKPESIAAKTSWELDLLATEIYNQIVYLNTGIKLRSELSSNVRIV